MKVTLLGVRGSIPTTGIETSYYGGNTSCVHVSEDDWNLVLDAGSGMQKIKLTDTSNKRVDVLLTHLHFDHIQGLGFFAPLFDPSMEVHIWAPASATQNLFSRLSRYLSPPLFPVLIRDLPCKLILHDVENSSFEIGPFSIEARYVIHSGPTVGYRIQGHNSIVSYIPDHEPALGVKGMLKELNWISGFDLISNADLMLHDGQYTSEEYQNRIGWGHSSMDDVIALATLADVKHLILTHHDPQHSDEQLDEIFEDLMQKHAPSFFYELAKEGMEILLA